MKKSQIIQKGLELGVDFSLTHSCYDPQEGFSCGRCDACILRLRAFREVGINDPIPYRGF
jgi:7-cyano-7-deazaguanine synthase